MSVPVREIEAPPDPLITRRLPTPIPSTMTGSTPPCGVDPEGASVAPQNLQAGRPARAADPR